VRPISPFALSAKVFATSASTPLMHLRSTGVYYTIFFIGAVFGGSPIFSESAEPLRPPARI
jgi:hypothetical protein